MAGSPKKEFNLGERTRKFGKDTIDFAKAIPSGVITAPLIRQFVRSGTSIGANYSEADSAESKKDFQHKLGICAKEAKESEYWLEMIRHADSSCAKKAAILEDEAQQLRRIFIAIINKSRDNI